MIYKVVAAEIFLCLFIQVIDVSGVKCYVCGIENTENCENFDPNNSSFIVNCPKQSSCGLQTQGLIQVRSCEDSRLSDCQKANNIEYCYCTKDLCNGVSIQFNPSDDEDDIEGSGTTTISITTPNTTVAVNHKSANGKQGISLNCLHIWYSLVCLIHFKLRM